MKSTFIKFFKYVLFSGLIVILISYCRIHNFFLSVGGADIYARMISGVIFFCMITIWGLRTFKIIIQDKIRRYMILMVIMMLLLISFRTFRYMAIEPEVRRMWAYCFYIPMLSLPLYAYKISKYLGEDENYSIPPIDMVWDGMCGIMIMYALTNDLHEWIYQLDVTNNKVDGIVKHQYGYFIIVLWVFVLCFYALFNILRKSRTMFRRFYYFYPLMVFAVGGGYTCYYLLSSALGQGEPFIDIDAITCWVYIVMWETMIIMGVIPNNHDYVEFFNESTLSAYITDEEGEIMYLSKGAEALPKEEFEKLKLFKELQLSEYKTASSYRLQKGHVVYVNDITEVQELIEELEDVRENLKGEKQLLEKITEAEAARIRIEEKERLFRKISDASRDQVLEIRALMNQLRDIEDPKSPEARKMWSKILILGTFLKRNSNLLLIGESDNYTSSLELKLSLQQSIENLKLAGPQAGMLIEEGVYLEVEWVIRCYSLFEAVVEFYLDDLESIHAMFSRKGDKNVYLVEAEYRGARREFKYPEEVEGTLQIEEDIDDFVVRACYKWENPSSTENMAEEEAADETD